MTQIVTLVCVGLMVELLLSVDVVTADGGLRHVSATEDPDLFWAMRGAGSNFGVVTSFEYRLHPVGPTVYLCAPMYALEDGPAVLRAWRDALPGLPDAFTPIAVLWAVPEGFPDRGYTPDGRLVPRTEPGALVEGADRVAAHAVALANATLLHVSSTSTRPRSPTSFIAWSTTPRTPRT